MGVSQNAFFFLLSEQLPVGNICDRLVMQHNKKASKKQGQAVKKSEIQVA